MFSLCTCVYHQDYAIVAKMDYRGLQCIIEHIKIYRFKVYLLHSVFKYLYICYSYAHQGRDFLVGGEVQDGVGCYSGVSHDMSSLLERARVWMPQPFGEVAPLLEFVPSPAGSSALWTDTCWKSSSSAHVQCYYIVSSSSARNSYTNATKGSNNIVSITNAGGQNTNVYLFQQYFKWR